MVLHESTLHACIQKRIGDMHLIVVENILEAVRKVSFNHK